MLFLDSFFCLQAHFRISPLPERSPSKLTFCFGRKRKLEIEEKIVLFSQMSCVKRHSVLFEFGPSILSFFGQKVLCTSKGFLGNVSKLSVAIANLVNLGHSEDFTPPSSEVGTEFLHEHTYFPVKKMLRKKLQKMRFLSSRYSPLLLSDQRRNKR